MPKRNLLNIIKKLDSSLKLPWYNPNGCWEVTYQDGKYGSGGTLDECIEHISNCIESTESGSWKEIEENIQQQCLTRGKAEPSDGSDWWFIYWLSND